MNTNTDTTVPETITEFTREFVESLDPKVKMVDSDGDIELFCYTTCDDSDPDYVKACRGLVFNKNELVLKAFSFCPDYTADDYEYLKTTYDSNMDKFSFFDSHEGAVIRVFYAQDKWYVSTNRRLDAFKSKWASRTSFGEHFVRALEYEFSTQESFRTRLLESDSNKESPEASVLEKFMSTLDNDVQYMFLIQNNVENRIVCEPNQYPRVMHVGSFRNGTLDLTVDTGLTCPNRHRFSSISDVLTYVEDNMDYTKLQGIIMFTDTDQIKIYNRQYKHMFLLRNNEPSIKYRYLQVRMDRDMKSEYVQLYSSYQDQFDMYENILYQIGQQILTAYISRYINREFITRPPEEYAIMKLCHAWHISDRSNNHISLNKVMEVLNQQPTTKLNKMIRRHINSERKEAQTEEQRPRERLLNQSS